MPEGAPPVGAPAGGVARATADRTGPGLRTNASGIPGSGRRRCWRRALRTRPAEPARQGTEFLDPALPRRAGGMRRVSNCGMTVGWTETERSTGAAPALR